ncbi:MULTISPECIES: hypothetical protein [Clavibacter]|uniref:DUF2127 domain-containing protein n=1 Tax=Clavibacter seminis TaxID=2860285 RepID=A0ABY3T8P0_9MICO|nr:MULTISPECIES: hypothetical protein [Clavibacter]KDP89904.1 hypothetical protein W824_10295 [Clavibacter cf. michiganensis LMG 26808]UKF24048.1 hypothetical protein KYT88_09930 [Clavibacter sp. A6099]
MTAPRRARRELRAAAVLLLVQGVLMEGLVAVGLVVLLALGIPQAAITDHAEVFALPYLRENLYPMMAMSGIFAALRITAAVGLWRDRLWGLALACAMCVVTLVLMVFLLPAGLLDGVLSGTALVLLLHARLGRDATGAVRSALSPPDRA